jgi:hypothetical protein
MKLFLVKLSETLQRLDHGIRTIRLPAQSQSFLAVAGFIDLATPGLEDHHQVLANIPLIVGY